MTMIKLVLCAGFFFTTATTIHTCDPTKFWMNILGSILKLITFLSVFGILVILNENSIRVKIGTSEND